jgi:hypothetical protein
MSSGPGESQPSVGHLTPQQQQVAPLSVSAGASGYSGQQPGDWAARSAKAAAPVPQQGVGGQGQAEGGAQEEKQFEQQLQQAFLLLQQIQQQQGPDNQ